MKTHLIALLFALTASLASTPCATGQTTRVNCGVKSDGYAAYRTVYEFDYVEEKPRFVQKEMTLMNFINQERRYPAEAYSRGVQGRVTCSFIVNADGSISHLKILKGVEPSLNREALRILSSMPEWTPGRIAGQKVPVRVICAVPFRK